jgi:hypothetical protein
MKAIAIRQPFAWLIVHGYKDVENRTWATSHRGPLLVHASKTLHRAASEVVAYCHAQGIPLPEYVDVGGIVGITTVVDVVDSHSSQWFTGPLGWVLRDARPLPFHPIRGRPGVWETGVTVEEIEGGVGR